jgi:hypothetical protein
MTKTPEEIYLEDLLRDKNLEEKITLTRTNEEVLRMVCQKFEASLDGGIVDDLSRQCEEILATIGNRIVDEMEQQAKGK